MCMENKKPTVVSLISNKGGVGKTHITIALLKYLAAAGKKVLGIDFDSNDSLGDFLLVEGTTAYNDAVGGRNIYGALSKEEIDMTEFVVPSKVSGVDIIASSKYLNDLRSINEKRLSRSIKSLDGHYDVVIIDCHPDFGNLELNAINASDYIITPVLLDTFSKNAASYISNVLQRDTEKYSAWYLLINGYNRQYENAHESKQAVRLEVFADYPQLPKETWVPWTTAMRDMIDFDVKIIKKSNPILYSSIKTLAEGFVDDESLPDVEEF